MHVDVNDINGIDDADDIKGNKEIDSSIMKYNATIYVQAVKYDRNAEDTDDSNVTCTMNIIHKNMKYNYITATIEDYEIDDIEICVSSEQITNKCKNIKFVCNNDNMLNMICSSLQIWDKERIRKTIEQIETKYNMKILAEVFSESKISKQKGLLLKGHIFNVIKNNTQRRMEKLIQEKSKGDLQNECEDMTCQKSYKHKIWNKCKPLQRLKVMLSAYKKLNEQYTMGWKKATIASILQYNNVYGYQQLVNDFLHMKCIHLNHLKQEQNTVTDILCSRFQNKEGRYCCTKSKCNFKARHYRERNKEEEQKLYFRGKQDDTKASQLFNNKDVIFQQECDKIHTFFLHSYVKLGATKFLDLPELAKQSSAHEFIEDEFDETWWRELDNIKRSNDDDVYAFLVQKYGIFSWQSMHGFRTTETQYVSNIKPKFKNIKEEVLFNHYQPLSMDNWIQTLRKSKGFFHSWARNRVRTKYKHFFEDKTTGKKEEWDVDVVIKIHEILTLKLYTDFANLQRQLKRCMRFDSVMGILNKDKKLHNDNDNDNDIYNSIKNDNYDKQKRYDLLNRLTEFYHWRCSLLIALNKFGTRLNEIKSDLYHGVNAKMLLNPSYSLACWGPLSTTTSYHVAKTFSTQKGMVLKISSQYPRLNHCNAFDVSLISDYPEENEWLIGFIYLRVLEVTTTEINAAHWSTGRGDKSPNDESKKAPWIRSAFLSVHLFKQQIFAMSPQLETMLIAFFYCSYKLCCRLHLQQFNENEKIAALCQIVLKHTKRKKWNAWKRITKNDINNSQMKKRIQIYQILFQKFEKFCENPNKKQLIKIDHFSCGLKQFFFEQNKKKKKEKISFRRIIKLFPKIKQMNIINRYKLDEELLSDLVLIIKNGNLSLNKIIFLYYDYKKEKPDTKPINSKFFQDPDKLNTKDLKDLGWQIQSKRIRPKIKVGWKIELWKPDKK